MTGNADKVSRNADVKTERCLSMSFDKSEHVSFLEHNQFSFLTFKYIVFIFTQVFHLIPE